MAAPSYLGAAVPVWTLPPNWASGVEFTCLYRNVIREALDTSEERHEVQPRCLYGISYSAQATVGLSAYFRGLRETAGAKLFGMPIWCMKAVLTADYTAGGMSIAVDDVGDLLNETLPPYAIVWESETVWEVAEWTAISPDNLTYTLAAALTGNYTAGKAYLIPLLFGELKRSDVVALTDEVDQWEVAFQETFNGIAQQEIPETTGPAFIDASYSAACFYEGPLIVKVDWTEGVAVVTYPADAAWDFMEGYTGTDPAISGGKGWDAAADVRAI